MRGLVLIAGAALALSACTIGADGEKHVDSQKVCEVTLNIVHTVAGVASVLEANGIKPEQARVVAEAAVSSGDVVGYTCAVLAAVHYSPTA